MTQTYCDNGQPFTMAISDRGLVTLTSVAKPKALSIGDRTPISRVRGERSTSTPPQRVLV